MTRIGARVIVLKGPYGFAVPIKTSHGIQTNQEIYFNKSEMNVNDWRDVKVGDAISLDVFYNNIHKRYNGRDVSLVRKKNH